MGKLKVNTYAEVSMSWPEASAEDVEAEIIKPMEEVFSSIKGLNRIFSTSENGLGRIVLVFKEGEIDNEIMQAIKRQLALIDKFPQTAGDPQIIWNK